jgi:hypothetical protein
LNLQNSFEDRRVQFPSLVDEFLGFAHNSFENGKAATCRFSKEFCENPVNSLTNRKEGNKIPKRIVYALPVFKRVL